jgi:hypothetical protein
MDKEKATCGTGGNTPPRLSFVAAGEDLELGSHAFLRPLPACCAQIASPYWARVIGAISNKGTDEVLARVVVTLFDEEGRALGTHEDFMTLDGGEKSEFDVKITGFYDNARAYGLEAVETERL